MSWQRRSICWPTHWMKTRNFSHVTSYKDWYPPSLAEIGNPPESTLLSFRASLSSSINASRLWLAASPSWTPPRIGKRKVTHSLNRWQRSPLKSILPTTSTTTKTHWTVTFGNGWCVKRGDGETHWKRVIELMCYCRSFLKRIIQ